jgi:hypothetical protein
VVDGAKALREIINDKKQATPTERLKGVDILFERVFGRRVAVDVSCGADHAPFMKLVAEAVVGTQEEAAEVLL